MVDKRSCLPFLSEMQGSLALPHVINITSHFQVSLQHQTIVCCAWYSDCAEMSSASTSLRPHSVRLLGEVIMFRLFVLLTGPSTSTQTTSDPNHDKNCSTQHPQESSPS